MTTIPKDWWTSYTLWFNIASLIVVVAGVFTDPALATDPRVVSAATAVVTVGNALLRILKTSQPIAGSPADPTPAPASAPAPVPPAQ